MGADGLKGQLPGLIGGFRNHGFLEGGGTFVLWRIWIFSDDPRLQFLKHQKIHAEMRRWDVEPP